MKSMKFFKSGPGSCKGRIVSDLHQGFGLHVIDVESVLLRRSDNIKLTLENLLQIVEKEMRNASAEAGFLIDLVPNLRNIERCLTQSNVRAVLERFEKNWPVAFALTLYGKLFVQSPNAEQILLDMQVEGAHDERDANRIRKRCTSFAASIQPIMSYFCERIVRVKHDGVNYERLWNTVMDLFWDLGLKARAPVTTTVYFLLEKREALRLPQYANNEGSLPRVPFILPPYLRARDVFDGVSTQISKQASSHREKFVAHLYPFMERIEWEEEPKEAKTTLHPPIRCKQPLFLLPMLNDGAVPVERRLLATTQGDQCIFSADIGISDCRRVVEHYAQARAAATSIPQTK
ncbi:uncharacterized protein LOC111271065 isoform X1 [Varroa jacobsoni]|uniref:uncharacterized protein LOC111271065 isoform X1 n=2 Tax=Varroa jacobsoni TaxID=62625 RepID=UPI000BF30838|nr:uncharacterized protein LOC111271065 isoform X1 [Varroa jacobsoni]